MSYKGKFVPRNPQKYKGNPNNIIYRSTWEVRAMKYFDTNPNVIWWASEEMHIKYFSPVDKRVHRYFPDFIIRVKRPDGTTSTYMIEIKPESQTKLRSTNRNTRKFIKEAATYMINQAKWHAATEFCKDHGWEFKVLTEKDLGIK
jgi:hypothetical protein